MHLHSGFCRDRPERQQRGDDARPYENEHPDVTTGCGDVNFPESPCPDTRSEAKANIVNLLPYKGLPAGSLHAFFFFRPKEALEPGGPWPNGPWARIGLEALGYETFRPSCARVGDFGALRRSSIGLLGFEAPGYGIFRLLGARLRDFWTFRRQDMGLFGL